MLKNRWIVALLGAGIFGILQLGACTNSTEVQVHGPDTTSHNFTWKIQRFGEAASSVLYDVAILDDTLAFAVGEIYVKDSLGQPDARANNLCIWNGNTWTLRQLNYGAGVPVIRSVFSFGPAEAWLDPWFHWDGIAFQQLAIDPVLIGFRIQRMWGNDGVLYAGGTNGFIGRFDGSRWRALATGTSLPIQDIWGATDSRTGRKQVLALASNYLQVPTGKKLLRIDGTNVSALSDSGLPKILSGLWFSAGKTCYVVGDGLFQKANVSDASPWSPFHDGLVHPYTVAVRGSSSNDIFIVGHFGAVLHFNGATWHNYQSELALTGVVFHAVAIKGNIVIAVGEEAGRAVTLLGRR
jgi:hypothetical protein